MTTKVSTSRPLLVLAEKERQFSDKFDADRQKIDVEIEELENSIRALKSRRNMFSPMTRLPLELLSRIFIVYATMCYDSPESVYDIGPTDNWIKVSHICSHWRAVALDCPNLWSKISFNHLKWSNHWSIEMLKRSKMASLELNAYSSLIGSDTRFENLKEALTHISRTRSLKIVALGSLGNFLKNLTGPAPILESLSLIDNLSDDLDFTLKPTFLSEGTPALRRLKLVRCSLEWNSTLLQNLTHMNIHNVHHPQRPTTIQLITMLMSMPLLEYLDLKDALPAFPSTATSIDPPSTVVNLPYLSRLYIESSDLECANLFSHISFSPSATLQLVCKATGTAGHNFPLTLTSLSRFMSSRKDPIHNLNVEITSHEALHIQAWSGQLGSMPMMDGFTYSDSQPPTSPPTVDLTFSFPEVELENEVHGRLHLLPMEEVINVVCILLPLVELRALRFSVNDFTAQSWISDFGSLKKLHTIHACYGRPVATLIEALLVNRVSTKQLSQMSTPNVYFLGLQSLCIEHYAFENEDCIDELRDALMTRFEEGAEVWSLSLKNCMYLSEGDVDLLREIVVDLDWDWVERGSSVYGDEFEDDNEFENIANDRDVNW